MQHNHTYHIPGTSHCALPITGALLYTPYCSTKSPCTYYHQPDTRQRNATTPPAHRFKHSATYTHTHTHTYTQDYSHMPGKQIPYDPLVYCCPPPGHTGTLSGTAAVTPNFLQPQPSAPLSAGEGNPTTPMPTTLEQPATTAGNAPVKTPDTSKNKEDLTLPISGLPPIPAHVVEAIKARRFVPLGDLLPEALRDAVFDHHSKDLKEEKRKRTPPLSNPTDWMCAYATFMAVSVHFQPERAFEMAAYGHIIAGLARDVGGLAWSRYDRTFRQAAAVNHQLPWSKRSRTYGSKLPVKLPMGHR